MTAINTAIRYPKGFMSPAAAILPCNTINNARVLPQEGQAIPVIFLKTHKVASGCECT